MNTKPPLFSHRTRDGLAALKEREKTAEKKEQTTIQALMTL